MEAFDKALEALGRHATEQQVREQNYRLRESAKREHLARKTAEKQTQELEKEAHELSIELDLYRKDFSERPEWMSEVRDKGPNQGTIVAFLSDVHAAEVVRPEEIGHYNAYNLEICEQRLRRFFERTILVARKFLTGVEYDGIVLAIGGDLVSGDIHEELRETNEVSTLRACELLIPWLAAGVEMFAEEFGKVQVVSAPGNHGRTTQKPVHKKRSEGNADTHIARLLANDLRRSGDAITFDIPESADVDFELYGYRFSMEHGDNLKFNGTSEIGSIGPVKRGNLRKTKKRQEQGKPFKYGLYGHFHQFVPAYTQGFVMNGSLKGYDEYASDGQFSPEPAQQALLVVTPEHGITVTAPVLVEKRSVEGW